MINFCEAATENIERCQQMKKQRHYCTSTKDQLAQLANPPLPQN